MEDTGLQVPKDPNPALEIAPLPLGIITAKMT